MPDEINNGKKKAIRIGVDVDTTQLDAAIEKANRLVELLEEASNLIDSLSGGRTDIRNLTAEVCTALLRSP